MQSISKRVPGCALILTLTLATSAFAGDRESGPKVPTGDRDGSGIAKIIKSLVAHILDLGQISLPPG